MVGLHWWVVCIDGWFQSDVIRKRWRTCRCLVILWKCRYLVCFTSAGESSKRCKYMYLRSDVSCDVGWFIDCWLVDWHWWVVCFDGWFRVMWSENIITPIVLNDIVKMFILCKFCHCRSEPTAESDLRRPPLGLSKLCNDVYSRSQVSRGVGWFIETWSGLRECGRPSQSPNPEPRIRNPDSSERHDMDVQSGAWIRNRKSGFRSRSGTGWQHESRIQTPDSQRGNMDVESGV